MVQPQQTHRPPLRSVLEAYVNITAATYTAKAGDRVIGVNRAGAVTITLPTAEVRKGRTYTIKDESGAGATNNITVATEGSENIDGSATDTIADNYGSITYYSDGTNWFTVPLLAVGSHTLASHSAKAHSDLTGIGTGDHHAQSHAHNSHTGTEVTADLIAAKGDLLGGSALDTLARLAVGSNGQHLEADSAQATGLKWVAKPGSSDISARAYHDAAQSIANNTDTVLAFNQERFDTDTIHDTVTNNSRLTATTAGVYIITCSASWASNATGFRHIIIRLNGATYIGIALWDTSQNDSTRMEVSTVYKLAATDYVEIMVRQTSGAALNILSAANYSPEFTMAKILG